MIDDKDPVQLSEYSFNVCNVLKTVVEGRNADSLDESVRVALEDLGRCVDQFHTRCSLSSDSRVSDEIERTLRRGANLPRVKRTKSKVEGHKRKIQEKLDTLDVPSAPLDGTLSLSERVPNLAPVDPHAAATTSAASGSGTFSVPPLPIPYGVLIIPLSTSMFQPADVWSDAHLLCMNSPP